MNKENKEIQANEESTKVRLKSLTEVEGTEKNPFTLRLKDKMYLQPRANTIIAKGENLINTTTGEIIEESMLIGRRKIVDKSQFAKIYTSEILALFDLSKAAINTLLYLAKVMDYENKALLNYKKEFKKVGYNNHNSVLKALRELMSNDIIYPHMANGFWWLNPIYIAKGERFVKYTEFVTEDYIKGQTEAMLKKQQKEHLERIDNETNGKLTKALNAGKKENIENIQFPDNNPFTK